MKFFKIKKCLPDIFPVFLMVSAFAALTFRASALSAALSGTPTSGTAASVTSAQDHEKIFTPLRQELRRTVRKLKFENFEPPYFASHQLLDAIDTTITARYGALTQNQTLRNRSLYVDIRYGSRILDNSHESSRGAYEGTSLEDDGDAIRHQLWLLSDQAYKQAIKDYLQKQGKRVSEIEKEKLDDFTVEKSVKDRLPQVLTEALLDEYRLTIKKVSEGFKKYREIQNSGVMLRRVLKNHYTVNSEGTELVTRAPGNPYFIYLWAATQASDGMNLDVSRTFSILLSSKLPDENELGKTREEMAAQLLKLRQAKTADPYTAPAILDPESTGVLFHEAIGHRLEGERQRDDDEGQTFRGQVGKVIIPEFLTVEDDPTLAAWGGKDLNGYYRYDEEAVPAQKVVLIENGILRNYLLSRRPIAGYSKSNGHGRAQFGRDPIGRMSNLFVKSNKSYPLSTLKKMLMEECKKQNKPFGLLIRKTRSGDTSTARGRYQAFRGTPEEVYQVNAETGEETLVRGVELVGTPLITINKILAAGDVSEISNAFCVAESGTIPVSTIAPYTLVREVELQRLREDKQRPPILPPPLYDSMSASQ